jgi:hypothetical protein
LIDPIFPATFALFSGLAFAQSMKLGIKGAVGTIASIALFPGILLALYLFWGGLRWWTVLAFVALSFIVGAFHAYGMRRHGKLFPLGMQPIYSSAFLISSLACVASMLI